MAYFNHAFNKTFVGTDGFTTNGEATNELTLGQFGFYDPKTWVNIEGIPDTCCPLVLVAGSIHPNDKIGKFHGGYAESVKSKTINPKYVHKFYYVAPCEAQQAQITVGMNTSFSITLASADNVLASTTITVVDTSTLAAGMTLTVTAGVGAFAIGGATVVEVLSATQFTVAITPSTQLVNATVVAVKDDTNCNKEFLCGETYNLRVDVKGSPVLRTLTRNTYYTADAYTGCCPVDAIAPVAVNPLIVYVNWAYQLLNSPLINPFIQVEITYSLDAGVTWLELGDGTSGPANLNLLLGYTLNPNTLPANAVDPADTLAGLIINGAYVDTRFENCTFYPNDSIIAFLEPVKIYASEVDLNGDPCTFTGLCQNDICEPIQLKGTGENVIRDLILTESYMQQPFYTGSDLRIREITNGTDVYDAIDRFATYGRYYIQHTVPRFNNPTGTFDNEQYLLEIVVEGQDTDFEDFMVGDGERTGWLSNCNDCPGLEIYACPPTCVRIIPRD